MSNKISFSCEKTVDVDVDITLTVVCAKCGEPLEAACNHKKEIHVSPCKNCAEKKVLTPEVMEELRAKFGEEVYRFLDLKRMLQE